MTKTPQVANGEFVDSTLVQSLINALILTIKEIGDNLHTPGLLSPSTMGFSVAGLTVTVQAPLPFIVLTGDGTLAAAHGLVDDADTSTYIVNFASLVPGSGSVTAYLLASATTIGADPSTVVGPGPGHPDYDPTFQPYEFSTSQLSTLNLTASTTPADNIATFEIARTTLTAGQGTITLGGLDRTHWLYASAVLNPTGVVPGSYSNANVTVQADGRVTGISAAVSFMAGEMKLWPGPNLPAGFFWCNGQAVSRTQFAALFQVIGTVFGVGDGTTTFNLPDMRGRVPVGMDNMGGAGTLGLLTATGSGVNGITLGAVGGNQFTQNHTHATTEPTHSHTAVSPPHAHTLSDPGHAHAISDPGHNHFFNDPGHAHAVADPGHAHGVSDAAHSHGISQNVAVFNTQGPLSGSGVFSPEIVAPQQIQTQASNSNIGIVPAATGIGIFGSGTGGFNSASATGIGIFAAVSGITITAVAVTVTIGASVTGLTIQGYGSGGSQNVQPSIVLNYIIYHG